MDIDPDLGQAMVALSIVPNFQVDLPPDRVAAATMLAESTRLAERAVAVAPDDPNALNRLGAVRVFQGRRAEAWPLVARAVEIAPTDPDVLSVAAWCYFFADQDQSPPEWAEHSCPVAEQHGMGTRVACFKPSQLEPMPVWTWTASR